MSASTLITVIDHVVIATCDVNATAAMITEQCGTPTEIGGHHVGLGTWNRLVSFGDGRYLEIIGPDPDQPAPDRRATGRAALVIGGGLGGLSAAIQLGAAGWSVTLLEAADQLENWRTAVRYQVWHGLALVLVALAWRVPAKPVAEGQSFALPAWAFLIGALLFSGSIYCLALGVLRAVMGPLTPLGGLLLLVGWASFAWRMVRP